MSDSAISWTASCQTSQPFTSSRNLLKLMSIESVTPSNHLILYHPFLLPPSIFPSFMVFSNELAPGIRGPKYWSFSFSISTSNENQGWFPLGSTGSPCSTRDSQNFSPAPHFEASILWHSAFFMVQFSHLHMTTGKIMALTKRPLLQSNISAF